LNNKKKALLITVIIIMIMIPLLIASVIGLNICLIKDDEVVFPIDTDELLSEESPDFEQIIRWQSEVEINGFNTLFSDEITCTVTAPDAASYIKENMSRFEDMDADEFNQHIIKAVNNGSMEMISTEIVLPVTRDGHCLIAETENNLRFKDASCGGLYTLYSDLMSDAINSQED